MSDTAVNELSFVLNGKIVRESAVSPTTTLLQYLRETCRLTGTKEGCAEGDCGACTVVVTEVDGGRTTHYPVNACIQLLPMLEGRAVTTVEHLRSSDGTLHPCQQALADGHGSQCGFCTPGFVMSLYAAYLGGIRPTRAQVNDLLAGNLCRCTGYGPIIDAAGRMFDLPVPTDGEAKLAAAATALREIAHAKTVHVVHDDQAVFSPATLHDFARLYAANPDAVVVAGATDVGLWVTKQHRRLKKIITLSRVRELQRIDTHGGVLTIGAGVTYRDAAAALGEHYPDFGELIRRLASPPVRSAGTIGGNIANGSPIGDTPPVLIALGATLVLRAGDRRRKMPLEEFFIAYGKQDRAPGEFIESIEVPLIGDRGQLGCYKISKRFDQDISAVCAAFNIEVLSGSIVSARVCYGGMAGTPKRASAVESALIGKAWTIATIEAALPAFAADYAPLTDMRGSAAYRMLVARNLLVKYFHERSLTRSVTRLVGSNSAFA